MNNAASEENQRNLRLAINDIKTYNSFVLIPQIDDNTKISNENYANNETKDTEQDWDNLIENLKAKIEKEKFAIDDLKISKENGIKSCRQEDLIYDFHEVCNVFITFFMNMNYIHVKLLKK